MKTYERERDRYLASLNSPPIPTRTRRQREVQFISSVVLIIFVLAALFVYLVLGGGLSAG